MLAGLAMIAVVWAAPLNPEGTPALAESYTSGSTTIDTDAPSFGPHTGVDIEGVAVFAFGELTIDGTVDVVGSRPVALLTTGDLTVSGVLDVSATGMVGGSGGHDAVAFSDGMGPGGGRAFDVGTGGAFCGDGGDADDGQRSGGSAYGDVLLTLEGGSAGGSSTDPASIKTAMARTPRSRTGPGAASAHPPTRACGLGWSRSCSVAGEGYGRASMTSCSVMLASVANTSMPGPIRCRLGSAMEPWA